MQIANCWLKHNKMGSDVPLRGVTPAEVAILRSGFEIVANGEPISDVVVYGQVPRKDIDELARLKRKYRNLRVGTESKSTKVVDQLFGGHAARLPQTFAEIGVAFTLGENTKPTNSPDVSLTEDEAARLEEEVTEV